MSDQKNHNQDHMAQATTDVLKDPVCGMTVTEESKYHEEFKGKTYFFAVINVNQSFIAARCNISLNPQRRLPMHIHSIIRLLNPLMMQAQQARPSIRAQCIQKLDRIILETVLNAE